jgi:hypothetical protein
VVAGGGLDAYSTVAPGERREKKREKKDAGAV